MTNSRNQSKYNNCTIYCIESYDGIHQYIGGTVNLYQRKAHHKYRCNNILCPEYKTPLYVHMRKTGGFGNYRFRILEENISVNNRTELEQIEKKYINLIRPSMNSYLVNKKQNRNYKNKTV